MKNNVPNIKQLKIIILGMPDDKIFKLEKNRPITLQIRKKKQKKILKKESVKEIFDPNPE